MAKKREILSCNEVPDHLFWLWNYLRSSRNSELLVGQTWPEKKTAKARALQDVMLHSFGLMQGEIRTSIKYVVESGQLLFAFPGTTVLEGGAA